MNCDCTRHGSERHHHRFGGTYPCEAPSPCKGCGTDVPQVRFEEPAWPAFDDLPMDC